MSIKSQLGTRFSAVFKPKPTLSEQEVQTGLKWWTREGTVSQGFWSITTSGFLVAYGLALGANNLEIGVLAALPMLLQPIQVFFIPMVEKLRWRKAICVLTWIPAQLVWLPIALIPLLMDVPSEAAVLLLLGLIALRGVFAAVTNCAWHGWIRDLVPQSVLGSAFARRQARATVVGIVFGLGAAIFIDFWKGRYSGDTEFLGYTYALLFGIAFLGLVSPVFMSRMPEPLMQAPPGRQPPIWSMLSTPFRDHNFRYLLGFLFLWGFSLNLAIPFFAVYMLQRLEFPLSAVIGFSVLSQTFNVIFLRVWGGLSDRFGVKAILSLCASLYLLVIFGWIFTTMPGPYFLTVPLLFILHILAGIASAGVTLGTGTIGMKLAPQGQSTSYLATAAMATSLGSGLGPLMGGLFADYFSVRELSLNLTWVDPGRIVDLPALSMTGFDFLFAIAFILGLLTLNILLALREEGEVERGVVLDALFYPGRQFSRPMSTVPGLNFLGQFPYGYLRRIPLPGLDVAVGVTAYQIAETARAATEAALKSAATTRKLTRALHDSLTDMGKGKASKEADSAHRSEVARQAVRGAVHAMDDVGEDMERWTHSIMQGVLHSLGWGRGDPLDALRGASHGVVQAIGEVGGDPGEAAIRVVDAARDLARQVGVNEDDAIAEAVSGVRNAAEAMGPEVWEKIEDALPPGVGEEGVADSGEKEDYSQ